MAPTDALRMCAIRTSPECSFLRKFCRRAHADEPADEPTDAGQHVQTFQITLAHGSFTSFQGIWLCNSTTDTAGASTKLIHPLNNEGPRSPEAGDGQEPEHVRPSARPGLQTHRRRKKQVGGMFRESSFFKTL